MVIKVTEALCVDTSEIITVERSNPGGAYVDGLYVKASTITFKTLASVQQPTPKDLQILPEGEREKDVRKFISKKQVRTTQNKDGLIFDIVIYKGIRYKIIQASDWGSYGYTRSFGVRN